MSESIRHYYRKAEVAHSLLFSLKEELELRDLAVDHKKITCVETEKCFNVLVSGSMTEEQSTCLHWLLAETFDKESLRMDGSFLGDSTSSAWVVEFGPRLAFTSAFSSNAVSICKACQLPVSRLELSRRYRLTLSSELSCEAVKTIKNLLHDRMTEEEYTTRLSSFDSGAATAPTRTIPIMEQGRKALETINEEMGLGFDDFDLDYYTNLFKVLLWGWLILPECLTFGFTIFACRKSLVVTLLT